MQESLRPRQRPSWIFVSLGIAVGILAVAGVGPPGILLLHTVTCALGSEVGTYTIWTPESIANIPAGGNVSLAVNEWNLTMTSGSLVTNLLRPVLQPYGSATQYGLSGGMEVNYGDFVWTFYQTQNESTIGSVAGPCTQTYVATMAVPGGVCGATYIIPIANNQSDVTQPHVWNGTDGVNGSEDSPYCPQATPGTYVWFDSSFHLGGSGSATNIQWNLCGLSGPSQLVLHGTARIPIVVTVPYGGHNISASGYLSWLSVPGVAGYLGPSAIYNVPGGWIWNLAPVGPASSTIVPGSDLTSLVAFVRLPC